MCSSKSHGCFIFPIKNNGERYAKPLFVPYVGLESSPADVVARLSSLNPGRSFEFDV